MDILVAPGAVQVAVRAQRWDATYVIDPGRHGMPAALASHAMHRPTIVEIGDPQGALFRAQGRSRPAIATGWAIDIAIVHRAAGIVFRGADLAATLKPSVPWRFIPDGVDVDLFRPSESTETRARLGLPPDELVVGTVGTINWSNARQWAYGLDVVEALGMAAGAPIRALIVGGGDGVEHLRRRAAELGVLDRVTLTGARPHGEVPGLLSAMDVCVSTQSNDAIGRGRTTAKLPEYLACDRFVLATDVGTAGEILAAEMLLPGRTSFDEAHHRRLAERLTSLCARRHELRAGAGTRRLALAHFDYAHIAREVDRFVRETVGRR